MNAKRSVGVSVPLNSHGLFLVAIDSGILTIGRDRSTPRKALGRRMAERILIVEDNELNMKLFNDLLRAHGYETIQTNDGVSAMQLARSEQPDLILMDIQLPEVSGLEVAKWLKADDLLCRIPIIAVTAFAMKGDEEKIRQGGCEDYLAKPIKVASFIQTVRKHLSDRH